MAYKAFLIRPYAYTHENQFFRSFSTQLRKSFKNEQGLYTLIGNVSCNGHQMDAIFIASGKIIVIDFKNYGGTLTFSENNPWPISSGKDFVFVKGGGRFRNPFHQVCAYRNSLIDFLIGNQGEILDAHHEQINFRHAAGLVLFHQPVSLHKAIPQQIQVYFHIADNNTCIANITDINSNQLVLSDKEIEKMLAALDVRQENIYDETQAPDIHELQNTIPHAAERLELVRKTLANVSATTPTQKLIVYYQTLIDLERKKEPIVQKEKALFHIDWANTADSININLEHSPEFHHLFQKNKTLQFPKNLFIGVNVSLNKQNLLLLHTIIPDRDILSHTSIDIPVEDFTLFPR